jgi:hypothetical protein
MRVVMALFRGKRLATMRRGVAQGTLNPPEGKSCQQVENRLNKLGRTKWHVHICERYPQGHGVLIDLARYLRGGPLSNARLLTCDGQQVVFSYTERATGPGGQARQRTMRLSIEPFIGALAAPCAPRWRRAGALLGSVCPQSGRRAGGVPVAVGARAGGGARPTGRAARGRLMG